ADLQVLHGPPLKILKNLAPHNGAPREHVRAELVLLLKQSMKGARVLVWLMKDPWMRRGDIFFRPAEDTSHIKRRNSDNAGNQHLLDSGGDVHRLNIANEEPGGSPFSAEMPGDQALDFPVFV